MTIISEQVRVLREKTGAGMMDCKRALEESGGDMDKAIEYLRKKGAATAQKRAHKSAKEGAIVTQTSTDGRLGVIVEINCETDFVARGEDFIQFAQTVAETAQQFQPATVENLMELKTTRGRTVSELLNELVGKVGEKIEVRRFAILSSVDGFVGAYTHMGNKIGVVVDLAGAGGLSDGSVLSRDIAMQIAAMNPQYISRDEISRDVLEREMEIYRTQARNEGKPENMLDRIASGRLEKFYQDVCLLEQAFIKDSAKTVKELLGDALSVRRFLRYQLGEN